MMFNNKNGQAILEIAIFGSIILYLFSVLLSYTQRLNDQQYVQMEAFRRVLQKAHQGSGSAAQLSLLQNRHHCDILSPGFKKGNTELLSASSSVYWEVSEVGATESHSTVVFRVNEDEGDIALIRDHSDPDDEGDVFEMGEMSFGSDITFSGTTERQEDHGGITNTRRSSLKETITTRIPYSTEEGGSQASWQVTQGVYRDGDGQYKYKQSEVGNVVQRERTWRTPF